MVALSTMEVEHMVALQARKAMWLCSFLHELGFT
jgi:hypothetical protein